VLKLGSLTGSYSYRRVLSNKRKTLINLNICFDSSLNNSGRSASKILRACCSSPVRVLSCCYLVPAQVGSRRRDPRGRGSGQGILAPQGNCSRVQVGSHGGVIGPCPSFLKISWLKISWWQHHAPIWINGDAFKYIPLL
jgi:hypothetical protein